MLKSLIKGNKGMVTVNDTRYFYKRNDAYVETLMEHVADLFGLNHAHYTPINVDDVNYFISEDLNNIGPFITAFDAGIGSRNIHDIREFIMGRFPHDFDSLMTDVLKMYYMDLLTMVIDRHNDNWGFLKKKGTTCLYVLDNDLAFTGRTSYMTSMEGNRKDTIVMEVQNIFDTFPQEDIDLFNSMFDKLDYATLQRLISETEADIGRELPFKEDYLSRYDLNRWYIDRIRDKKNKTKEIEQ